MAPGSLWTAAFPTYRTPRMLPYLASSCQTPFLHLGTQFESCSLAHPEVPSMITFARPLWRLWETLDEQYRLRVYCTQGGPQVLHTDSPDTGASLFVTKRGEALLILANYRATARTTRVRVDWRKLGLSCPPEGYALTANADRNQVAAVQPGRAFSATLGAHAICGWLLVNNALQWRKPIARFLLPLRDGAPGRTGMESPHRGYPTPPLQPAGLEPVPHACGPSRTTPTAMRTRSGMTFSRM